MNMQDKITETTISLLKEAYTSVGDSNLDNYIKNNINTSLQNSALRIYNAIDFDISEKDKRILALALQYRFAGTTSTIPPFILDKLPYTDTINQIDLDKKEVPPEDEAKQLYKSSKFIKYIYQFNSDEEFNIDDIKNYINNTNLPIIVQYGAFNKDYNILNKNKVLKAIDYYKSACDIEEYDKCVFITFFTENDLQ